MLKVPSKAQMKGAIDLGAIKDAAVDPVAGIDVFGPVIYHAVLTRSGLTDMGECTPPDVHPETGKPIRLAPHTKVQLIFHNLMRLIREEKASAIVYNADSTILSHLVPIVALLGKVPFIGIRDQDLGSLFGFKNKKEFVRDIKKSNPLPENVGWPSYGALGYALYGVKLKAAEARRETAPEILKPSEEGTTPSGLVLR